MNRRLATIAAALTVCAAGCGPAEEKAPIAPDEPAMADAAAPAPSADAAATVAPTPTNQSPAFAAVFPDAVVQGEPLAAEGASGPGGALTFLTPADPEAVVAFYRERAEAAGLTSVMAMNQGEARAYGAEKSDGASVQVVASPGDGGDTSVQLTWSAGR